MLRRPAGQLGEGVPGLVRLSGGAHAEAGHPGEADGQLLCDGRLLLLLSERGGHDGPSGLAGRHCPGRGLRQLELNAGRAASIE